MSISEKIYNLRKNKNMSQEELANVLKVSRQTISKWETGESTPDFDKIVPLCDFFGITTDELLKGDNRTLEKEVYKTHKKNRALTFSLCIALITIMTIMVVFLDEIGARDSIMVTAIMICVGLILIILVNYFLSNPLSEVPKVKTSKKENLINSIINTLTIMIYLIFSFTTSSWEYSWIIFIIAILLKKIISLILLLGSDKNE